MLKKAMLVAALLALSSSPAWALPGNASSHGEGRSGEAHETHEAHGKANGKGHSNGKGEHGKSHKCKPHRVAYVAAGILVSESLEEGEHNTYSGELTVEVQRTNRHAREDKGMTKTYVVEGVHVHGPVSVEALEAGDRARLIGGVTKLPRKCESSEFSPTTTIRKLIFHAPRSTTTPSATTSAD